MANIQSQIKRNRQNEKRRLRNRDSRGAARSAVKDALAAIAGGQDSKTAVDRAIVALDKAARKGAIHHRNAARRKSRLIKHLSATGQAPAAMPVPQRSATRKPVEVKPEPKAPKARTAEPKAKKPVAKKAATKKTAKK